PATQKETSSSEPKRSPANPASVVHDRTGQDGFPHPCRLGGKGDLRTREDVLQMPCLPSGCGSRGAGLGRNGVPAGYARSVANLTNPNRFSGAQTLAEAAAQLPPRI